VSDWTKKGALPWAQGLPELLGEQFKVLVVGLVLIVVRVATTGKSMCRWCVSVSVTGGPEKFWFVGMVEKG